MRMFKDDEDNNIQYNNFEQWVISTLEIINKQLNQIEINIPDKENTLELVKRISENTNNQLIAMSTIEQKVKVPFFTFDDNAQLPKRNRDGDIGYDCFATEIIVIEPHSSAKIPLGVGFIVPNGYSIACRTRSGKWLEGLLIGNAHVDCNYRGQINCLAFNVTNEPITINKGDRPCSLDLFKTYEIEFQPIKQYLEETGLSEEDIMNTNRGSNGHGSSGN